jgi:hypothetical protein
MVPLSELAALLGKLVRVEKLNGFKFQGEVEWLNKDGTFHVTDCITGSRIRIQPGEIAEVLRDDRPKPVEYNGLYCTVCGEPQFLSDGGDVCKNGHGGAPGRKDKHAF